MVSRPEVGSHPRFTEKSSCRISANQKTGIAIPRNEAVVAEKSNRLYWRTALYTPRGKATRGTGTKETIISYKVAGRHYATCTPPARPHWIMYPRSSLH